MEYVLIWELLQLPWRQRQLGMIGRPSAHKRAPPSGPSGLQPTRQYKCNIKSKIYTFARMRWLLSSLSELSGTTAPSPFVPSLADMNGTLAESVRWLHMGTHSSPLPLSFFLFLITLLGGKKKANVTNSVGINAAVQPSGFGRVPLKLLHLSTGGGSLRLSSQLHFLSVSQLVAARADVCHNSTMRVSLSTQ